MKDNGPLVLVTGATGHAGRFVVRTLLERGFRVRGHYHHALGQDPAVEWRAWDFLENLDVGPLVEGCAAVVHLAAALTKCDEMERLNVQTPLALAQAAAAAGVRYFAHASSIVVYGSPKSPVVTEATPRLDPGKPLGAQYRAEPYMLRYACTKVMGELALEAAALPMQVDLLRPVVVADSARLLEVADWSFARKALTLYRRTQYIADVDAAAAVAHLVQRGVERAAPSVEAYNIAYETSVTFRQLCANVYRRTGDHRFAPILEAPLLPDIAKDMLRFRTLELRYPFGAIDVSAAKLYGSGFRPPLGMEGALDQALHDLGMGRPAAA
jgi:nucleoside-diphosphate-sugar epimerase